MALPMIYLLFLLAIVLITTNALALKLLQRQRLETSVAQRQLNAANTTIRGLASTRKTLVESNEQVMQLQAKIKTLNNQLDQLHAVNQETAEQLKTRQQKAAQRRDQLEQMREAVTKRDASLRDLNEQVENLRGELYQLRLANQNERQSANHLYNEIEREIENEAKQYKAKIEELENTISLFQEIQRKQIVIAVENQDNFINLTTLERDLYSEEIKSIVVEVLKNSLLNVHSGSRTQHVITDVVNNNSSGSLREDIKADINSLFRDYTSMNSKMKQALKRLGFELVADNSHYKFVFCQDDRYTVFFSKTPSDRRAGRNIAKDICHVIL
ncbi:MAG: hypothetical protein WA939_13720 [Nodosilinea sp.]